ncbi:MAG TPA: GyrI-like domain-containing protein [Chryseolinea sp.]|nr:GyrI-like domain-containing protein [Chryseolinea sp.]HPH46816.1 GyrI-like domain-containing protein [Chryseolinea sp.]HPM28895.1 GyrI-like domain-containing protein [Chryseolinea sp.]
MQPEIKEIKPINFLFYRAETKVNELEKFFPIAKELFKESVRLDLHVTGPVHWHYFGFTGDESKSFTLEVALPISQVVDEYDGKFHFKRTDNYKCVTLLHEGAWTDIPQSYGKIMQFVAENNLQPLGTTRELYINADFTSPEANVTQIQLGVN